ncbi:MAG TPA: DUF1592 domain-containing protein [Gammaproteobacteria bacterium]|nr:DUF1592 domain-containing protein [Gammaproteobacteria bacterium]
MLWQHAHTNQAHWSVIKKYCFDCHNSAEAAGNRVFDRLSPDHIADNAETWEAAIRKLQGGLMPPAGERRPDRGTVLDLVSWLENEIDDAAAAKADPGRVGLRRLNRREYAHAIHDLLDLDIDPAQWLPQDNVVGHFDNDADALQVSPAFVSQYIDAARAIAQEAIGDLSAQPVTSTYGDPANMVISLPPQGDPGTGRQQHYIPGMPFGTRGGFTIEHDFPADGEYELTIGDMALAREVPRMEFENTVVALLDGKEFYRTNIGGEADHKAIDQHLDPAVEAINNRLRKIRFNATAGQHELTVTFVQRSFAESDERIREVALEGGQERIQAAHALQIRGPLKVTGLSDSPSRKKIFVCRPPEAPEEACANEIVTNLAERAFRRPVTDDDLDPLMAFYDAGKREGGFERGIRDALSAILASPNFLYRAETGQGSGVVALNDLELASRLSFFLWGSLPDAELLKLGEESKLHKPSVLKAQIDRMLADDRAKSLTDDFAFQWLGVAKLDTIVPDRAAFPQASGLYDPRNMFKEELRLFVDSVLRSDQSVTALLNADYTFLNERLAMHYGIENVKGARFRRVQLTDESRYGLLGKGAIEMMTAYPNRTSPVLRGAWILERILGSPPPEPPPQVPTLKENRRGETPKTLRERMEQHRANPTCFACHGVMDPLGFALENFSAVGQYRTDDPDTHTPIDASGVLPDGTPVKGPEDLRRALASHPDQFVQALTENLMTYALGRRLTYRDMPTVRAIVREAAKDDYRFASIVLGVVSSDAFTKRDVETLTQVAPEGTKQASLTPADRQPSLQP